MKSRKRYAAIIVVLMCILAAGGVYGYMEHAKRLSTTSRIYSGRAEERLLSEEPGAKSYTMESWKVKNNIRVAVISDINEARIGTPAEEQFPILYLLRDYKPDTVCIAGDLLDGEYLDKPAWELMHLLSVEFDCYYVTGDHEFKAGKAEECVRRLEEMGITVLRGEGVYKTYGNTTFGIFGADDPGGIGEKKWRRQLEACEKVMAEKEGVPDETFSIMISHRPESILDMLDYELVVTGPPHGAADAAPYYKPGMYPTRKGAMIVNPGIANEETMEIELAIVDILPPGGQKEERISW